MSGPAPNELRPENWNPTVVPHSGRLAVHLPAAATSFIGREALVEDIGTLLCRPGVWLVTLTGPGGVGKTRVALRTAECMKQEFADGVAYIDFTSTATASHVESTIAQVLGMRRSESRPTADRLIDALQERHALLVFDNFEPLVEAAPFVAHLLTRCPHVKVLVTSREPLRLSAEWVIPVPPLGLPGADRQHDDPLRSEAVRLFAERAQAARSDFRLTGSNAQVVSEIVRRLDGLPLAIELAAGRLSHLTPAALLERLGQRLPLLTGGARDLPERQQTMRGAIAWSYDLLSPVEQRVFRQLAVFVNGCTLESAGAVAGEGADPASDALDTVRALVSRSLLRLDEGTGSEPRFQMLETVREFGLERLIQQGEEGAARDRHAAYMLALAERADPAIWGGPDHGMWLDRLESEFANLRAALTWLQARGDAPRFLRLAAALGGFWHYRSHRVEGRHWLAEALAIDDGSVPAARAMALIKLGMLERVLGGVPSIEPAQQALELRIQVGDLRAIGRAMMNLAHMLRSQGRYDEATTVLNEAFAVFEPIGDTNGLANVHMALGQVALDQGDTEHAETLLKDALVLYRQDGFQYGVAYALLAIGRLKEDRGDLAHAARDYGESLGLWRDVKSQEGIVEIVHTAAALAFGDRRVELAAMLAGAASAMGDALGYVAPLRERTRHQHVIEAAESSLGTQRFTCAWESSRHLSPDAAVSEAATVIADIAQRTGPVVRRKDEPALFTRRETDVLRLIVEGRSDREIAQELGLSYRTVTSYTRNILDKFNVGSRTAAATQAIRLGFVTVPGPSPEP